MNNFFNGKITDIAEVNPSEKLTKGVVAKKIPMSYLQTFNRKVTGYDVTIFYSGPKFRNNDTLLAKITPCLENGKTGLVDILDEDEVAFGSSEFIVLRPRIQSDQHFLYYFSISPIFRKRAISSMEGTSGRKRVNESTLSNYIFQLPNTEDRQKIGYILSLLDSKIELNNRINTELEQMAKKIFDFWFEQFDFPDENGKPYKSSGGKMVWSEKVKREIPEGWKPGVASELFEFNPTLSIQHSKIASYIDMSSLPTVGFMTKKVQKKQFNGGVKFQNGDLIISRITPCLENGKTGLITLLDDNEVGFGSTEFIVIRGKKRTLSGLAAFLARSELFRKFAITNMLGTSGRKRVEAKALEGFPFAIPEDTVLEKFEKTIQSFFDMETKNTEENQILSDLRDWILPMLMNRQIKVDA